MAMKKKKGISVSESEQAQAEAGSVVELQKGKEEETLVPPKLDDGFYEIETIRPKRVRKGEVQYLIKWRGWPETANTWEPLQNLHSVPDLIHAFEDSLKSGKHRKRRRKNAVHPTLPNKTPHRSTTSYSLRHFPTDTHPPLADQGQTNADPTTLGKSEQANANTSKDIVEKNEGNNYDPMLTELKATINNGVDADRLAIHFQQARVLTADDHLDGQSKVDCKEPVQSRRCRGAKRRKSGSVKRFKKETNTCEPVDTQNPTGMSVGTVEPSSTGIAGNMENSNHNKMEDARTAPNIVKIIKAIGYSASVSCNIQDILVTFMAMRLGRMWTTGLEMEVWRGSSFMAVPVGKKDLWWL
ncbi:Chromo-like domain superfamily [Sesbania bispinosa]|nr:Chromo-like domain superfamily [Sesbania bispinosa]